MSTDNGVDEENALPRSEARQKEEIAEKPSIHEKVPPFCVRPFSGKLQAIATNKVETMRRTDCEESFDRGAADEEVRVVSVGLSRSADRGEHTAEHASGRRRLTYTVDDLKVSRT